MLEKVFIPSAGIGSRVADGTGLNKAFLTIGDKPAISHIIDSIPKKFEIVVALGYGGELLKEYLEFAHQDRKITTFFVSEYEGEGTGLGLTLYEAAPYLQCPFVIWPNDTFHSTCCLRQNNLLYFGLSHQNYYRRFYVPDFESGIDEDSICRLDKYYEKDKSPNSTYDVYAYTGVASIWDFKEFWAFVESVKDEPEFISAAEFYVATHIKSVEFALKYSDYWEDTGNESPLRAVRSHNPSKYGVLPKPDEATWFTDKSDFSGEVIKYSSDSNFIKNRATRANQYLENIVPEVRNSDHFLAYKKIVADRVSDVITTDIFGRLLEDIKRIHIKRTFNDWPNLADFYVDKTVERIDAYLGQYPDDAVNINGTPVGTIWDLFNRIDFTKLTEKAEETRIHGDLQLDNILIDKDGLFHYIDWRQDFGGALDCGDNRYDYAKLLHSIVLPHDSIRKNLFSIAGTRKVNIDWYRKQSFVEMEQMLERRLVYMDDEGIEIITGLVFINCAPLHHHPFNKLLFNLGKLWLTKVL